MNLFFKKLNNHIGSIFVSGSASGDSSIVIYNTAELFDRKVKSVVTSAAIG